MEIILDEKQINTIYFKLENILEKKSHKIQWKRKATKGIIEM